MVIGTVTTWPLFLKTFFEHASCEFDNLGLILIFASCVVH